MNKCFITIVLSFVTLAFNEEITLIEGEEEWKNLKPTTTYQFIFFIGNKPNVEFWINKFGRLDFEYFENCYVYEYFSRSESYYKINSFSFTGIRTGDFNEYSVFYKKSHSSVRYIVFELKPYYYEISIRPSVKAIDDPKDLYVLSSGKKLTLDLYTSLDYNFFLPASKSDKVKFTITFESIRWNQNYEGQEIFIYECFSENNGDCDRKSRLEYYFYKDGKETKLNASHELYNKDSKYVRFRLIPSFTFRTSDIEAEIESNTILIIIIIVAVTVLIIAIISIYLICRYRRKKKSLESNIITNEINSDINKPLCDAIE